MGKTTEAGWHVEDVLGTDKHVANNRARMVIGPWRVWVDNEGRLNVMTADSGGLSVHPRSGNMVQLNREAW